MGLKAINPLIKAVAKKVYVAPKVEVRTLDSFGKKAEKIGDMLEFSNNPIEFIHKNISRNDIPLKKRILSKLYYFLLKYLSPDYNFEILRSIELRNFKKIKFFKNLSEEEIELLNNALRCGEEPVFFATMTGKKPACLIGRDNVNLNFLKKLNQNGSFNKDFDIHLLEPEGNSPLVYIFNRKKTLEIIQSNKNLYISRLGLPKETPVDEIYRKLIDGGNQYLDCTHKGKFNDLVGVTLGFPKMSSMMFQLEKSCIKDNMYTIRHKKDLYKKLLLEILNSDKSPYKNLPKDEFNMLKNAIENYKNKRSSLKSKIYQFVELTDEPQEIQRIKNEINTFNQEFSLDLLL